MVTTQPKQTASETVLLAADDLAAAGKDEFTEFDLTVAAWSLDRARTTMTSSAPPAVRRTCFERIMSSPRQVAEPGRETRRGIANDCTFEAPYRYWTPVSRAAADLGHHRDWP